MGRRMKTVLIVMLALVCAGCRVDVAVDVVMREDGSGMVTVTAIADAEVVQKSPNLTAELRLDDVRAAGWSVVGPTPTPTGGLQVVLTHRFETPEQGNELLAQIGGTNGPLVGVVLDKSESGSTTTYTLNGSLQVTGGLDAFSDAELGAAVGATPYASQVAAANLRPDQAVGITFSATLPGTLDTTTATNRRALKWEVPFDDVAVDLATKSAIKGATNEWASPVARAAQIAMFAWIGLAVIFIAYVLWARRRRRIENQPWY